MKTNFLIFLVILNISYSYGQKWENIYGNPGTDESFDDAIEYYDHGYLLASYYELNTGCWLIKTDINGNTLWEKIISWPDVSIFGGKLYQDLEGNIIIATVVAGEPSGYWPMMMKLDACGEKVWCRVFQDDDFNYGWFNDVMVLDNGDIIGLGYLDSDEEIELVFIYYIDPDGNLLWRQGYASQNNYPHIRDSNGDEIIKYGDKYLINGHCYYPYPTDTTHFFLRPLFIMLDSSFNEEWVLPFGVNDSIVGWGYHTIKINDSIYMGVGMRRLGGMLRNSLMMYFNESGEEINYVQIPNESITTGLISNAISDIARINDTLFLASTNFGYINTTNYPWGEMLIDTSGNIFKYEIRSNNTTDWTTMVHTFDDKYTIGCGWKEGNAKNDIYLYKINANLEQDTLYPGNYTYDSLCSYPIQSGEVDISDCIIITDVGEVPTPDEYFAGLQGIPVKVFPNPASKGSITFEFQNTRYHSDIELRCFNIFGELVHSEQINACQVECKVSTIKWKPGIYLALVYAHKKVVGRTKYIVR